MKIKAGITDGPQIIVHGVKMFTFILTEVTFTHFHRPPSGAEEGLPLPAFLLRIVPQTRSERGRITTVHMVVYNANKGKVLLGA